MYHPSSLSSVFLLSNDKSSLISCPGPGPGPLSRISVFKPNGLEDPGVEQHLTLSTARQEEEEKEEEVRGDSKPHSQDNGWSVELAETLRALRHVKERQRGKMEGGKHKKERQTKEVKGRQMSEEEEEEYASCGGAD